MRYSQIKLTKDHIDQDAAGNMLNLVPTGHILESDMLQIDFSFYIIWWVVPIVILLGRLALVAYRTRKKRNELRRIEEKSTPFTQGL